MASKKISELTAVTPAAGDLLPVVDVSDTTDGPAGSSRRATVADVLALASTVVADDTTLGTLTEAAADALFMLVSNAAGNKARKAAITSVFRAILAAADAAGVRSAISAEATGTAAAAVTAHEGASDPHPQYTTAAEATALAPVQSVAGRTGAVTIASTDLTDSTSVGRAVVTAVSQAEARTAIGAGVGDAITSGTLAQFAPTTSSQLAGVLSDETGSGGGFVRATAPTLSNVTLTGTTTAADTLNTRTPAGTSSPVNFGIDAAGSAFTVWYTASDYTRFVSGGSLKGFIGAGTVPFIVSANGRLRLVSGTGVVNLDDGSSTGCTLSSVPLTPAQITADPHNYAPGVARYYRLSTDGSPRRITGWSISQVNGQEFWAINVDATQTITIGHQDAGSTAANRVISGSGADIAVAPGECVHHVYDATTSRFRAWKV